MFLSDQWTQKGDDHWQFLEHKKGTEKHNLIWGKTKSQMTKHKQVR